MSTNNTLLRTAIETALLKPRIGTQPAPALAWHETSEFKSFLRSITAAPLRPATTPGPTEKPARPRYNRD